MSEDWASLEALIDEIPETDAEDCEDCEPTPAEDAALEAFLDEHIPDSVLI